ncbi:hypothetical protein BgiBS90_028220, partial [Biomphalaria glabrata]
THEIEILESSEADISKLYVDCQKNPGHKKFVPVSRFTIKDLPEGYQDALLCLLVKAVADLTVRIRVDALSPRRPKFWPNTETPYPFHGEKNNIVRCGSGQITAYKYVNGYGTDGFGNSYHYFLGSRIKQPYKTCPCEECQQSPEPSTIWWDILVHTATHVVFDHIEARSVMCRLFYDDVNSAPIILANSPVCFANEEHDKTILKFVTCDPLLGGALYKKVKYCFGLWQRIWEKFKYDDKFIFIVSHPHGFTKQVSFGKLIQEKQEVIDYTEDYDLSKLAYTTCTCPGSSGATVHCLGFDNGHCHSGTFKGTKWNFSCVCYSRKRTYRTK